MSVRRKRMTFLQKTVLILLLAGSLFCFLLSLFVTDSTSGVKPEKKPQAKKKSRDDMEL